MRESHLPCGMATGGCRGPDDPPPLDPTHDVHYTYIAIKMHSSYWYNYFAKLCHTMITFGTKICTRMSSHLPVWYSF